MKLIYTEQALISLEEVFEFLAEKMFDKKLIETRDKILDAADTLLKQPYSGQKEFLLEHLKLDHRRLVKAIIKSYTGLLTILFTLQIFLTQGRIQLK